MNREKFPRGFVLGIVFGVMFLILTVRLFCLQIIRGEEYAGERFLRYIWKKNRGRLSHLSVHMTNYIKKYL